MQRYRKTFKKYAIYKVQGTYKLRNCKLQKKGEEITTKHKINHWSGSKNISNHVISNLNSLITV